MNTLFGQKSNFLLDFFEKNQIPNSCENVTHNGSKELLFLNNHDANQKSNQLIYSVGFVPEYLKLSIKKSITQKTTSQYNKGYAIVLDDFKDVDSYVKSQFKNNSKNILNRIKRLNMCFDIRFNVYNKGITEYEYKFLMEHFSHMLTKRFAQRGDKNKKLQEWGDLYQTVYPLLKQGKASLFVLNNADKPIHISLCYHVHDILFSAIPAYDIDYYKFGLGNIGVYKKVEWCIENNYKVLEMGYGDLDYKRRWSNLIYNFQYHTLYSTNKIFIRILGSCKHNFHVFKEFLKKKRLNQKIIFFKNKIINPKKSESLNLKIELILQLPLNSKKKLIDIQTEEYGFLRKFVYDFQYLGFESSNNITVYALDDYINHYMIIGKNKTQVFKLIHE